MVIRGSCRLISIVLAAICLVWLSIVNGLGRYFDDRVSHGDDSAVIKTMRWQPMTPAALLREGVSRLKSDPEEATRLLVRAYRANRADPRPLFPLAGQLRSQGDLERSDRLIELAAQLAPADLHTQILVADHWWARGQFDKVLKHWSTALELKPQLQAILFPKMLEMVEFPQFRQLFIPFAKVPPLWWMPFFHHVSTNALNPQTVRYCYGLRRTSRDHPLTPVERDAYVARLQRDGLIADAYLVWLGGLEKHEREQLGLLFDGGFELPLKHRGFGWQLSETKNFTAKQTSIQGVSGMAMWLWFTGFDGYFDHLYQPLFLDPGVYRLTGRMHPDGLDSKGGLRWQVRCILPQEKVLAESQRFLGTGAWSEFNLKFEVMPGCTFQQLTLVSGGDRAFERKLNGSLWFDDLKIARQSEPNAKPQLGIPVKDKSGNQPRH
jgi:hypothetical protein